MKLKYRYLMNFLRSPEDGGSGGGGGAPPDKKTKEKDGHDEGSGSGILDELNDLGSDDKEVPGDSMELQRQEELRRSKEKDDNPEGDEQEKKEGEPVADDEKLFASLDEPEPPGGPAIKKKFGLMKSDLKKADEMIRSLRKEAADNKKLAEDARAAADGSKVNVEETEQFKALKKQLDEASEIVERTALLDSKTFADKFEAPIKANHKKAAQYCLRIADRGQQQKVAHAMDALLQATPPGEDNDPDFYQKMEDVLQMDGITDGIRRGLDPLLTSLRVNINERFDAVTNWKKTKQEVGDQQTATIVQNSKKIRDAFGIVRSSFEATNKDIITKIVGEKDPYQYVDTTKKMTAGVQDDMENLMKTGVPPARFLSLVSDGIEYQTLARRHNDLLKLAGDMQSQLTELKKKMTTKADDSETEIKRRKAGHSNPSDDDDGETDYGILGEIEKARRS